MERYVNNRLKQNTLLKGTLGDQSISKLVNHRPFSHDSVTFSSLSGSTLTQASMHTFMNTRMSSIELYNVLCIQRKIVSCHLFLRTHFKDNSALLQLIFILLAIIFITYDNIVLTKVAGQQNNLPNCKHTLTVQPDYLK